MGDDVHADPNIKVNEFIQNAQGDIHKLNQTLNYHLIIQKIIGIALLVADTHNSFCWALKSSGFFTTKSAAWLAQGYSLSNRPPWQCK